MQGQTNRQHPAIRVGHFQTGGNRFPAFRCVSVSSSFQDVGKKPENCLPTGIIRARKRIENLSGNKNGSLIAIGQSCEVAIERSAGGGSTRIISRLDNLDKFRQPRSPKAHEPVSGFGSFLIGGCRTELVAGVSGLQERYVHPSPKANGRENENDPRSTANQPFSFASLGHRTTSSMISQRTSVWASFNEWAWWVID
jgi:hypothetical protein